MLASTPIVPTFSLNLIGSYGACLTTTFLAYALWGVNCNQSFTFFTSSRKDHWAANTLVAWLWVCETVQLGLITRGLFTPLVLQWGDIKDLSFVITKLTWQILLYGFVAIPAQGFFMFRIWSIMGRKLWILILMGLTIIWQFVVISAYLVVTIHATTAHITTNDDLVSNKKITSLIYAILGTGLVVDVLICVTLIVVILHMRTGLSSTDRLITRIVLFAINTGLWTATLALAIMIVMAMEPNSLIYLGLQFLTSGFYCTSVLANLNGRTWVREGDSRHSVQTIGSNHISRPKTEQNVVRVAHVMQPDRPLAVHQLGINSKTASYV